MADKNSRNSLIACFLFDVIRNYGSRDHQLSQDRIRKLIASEYSLLADRKTIARGLAVLLDEDAFHIFRDEKTKNYYYDRKKFISCSEE